MQFAKVDRGEYVLKRFLNDQSEFVTEAEIANDDATERKLIVEALGVYWNRSQIFWKTNPDILGVQQIGAVPVNFSHQTGVYLLHDGRETIYVGQAVEQSIGKRLYQHTMDRLSGRWDRFSWYGFYGVSSEGEVAHSKSPLESLTLSELADTLEGILIECIEPRQNRKRGNTFSGIEYIQVKNPEIIRREKQQLWQEMGEKIHS